MRTTVVKVGENRNSPRIYLQGRWLVDAGFAPGDQIEVDFGEQAVTVTAGRGDRKVSGKFGNSVAVIDINTPNLARALAGAGHVKATAKNGRIVITPAYTVMLMRSRELVNTEASFYSGGGMLTLAAKLCGFAPRLAVEINEAYADVYQRNHPEAHLFNGSVEETPWESLKRYRPIGLMTMGIPCEPFSRVRRVDKGDQKKRDKELPPEAHDLGDMVFWALRGVEALNPHTLVCEEVPDFLRSGAGFIFTQALRRLYPHVEARVFDSGDYGCLAMRRRAIVVASNNPIRLPEPSEPRSRLADVFDPEPHKWFNRETKPWFFEHREKHDARGNNFSNRVFTADSPRMGAISKRYFNGQGGNPVIKHPSEPDTYRWLTMNEVKRLHGIPDDYYLGTSMTTAGEVIGQGVIVPMFQQIIASVTGRG